mgnify:FL=1
MSKKKKKKTYWIPDDLEMNPYKSSWMIGSGYDIPEATTFDINMPIHPDYIKILQPQIGVGDLVESHNGKIGIVVEENNPGGVFLTIKEANNKYYTVLVGDKEEKYIGYSLKKIKK